MGAAAHPPGPVPVRVLGQCLGLSLSYAASLFRFMSWTTISVSFLRAFCTSRRDGRTFACTPVAEARHLSWARDAPADIQSPVG